MLSGPDNGEGEEGMNLRRICEMILWVYRKWKNRVALEFQAWVTEWIN